MLTQARLKELFEYRDDGQLIWKITKGTRAKQGEIAGYLNKCKRCSYIKIEIDGKQYKAHRLIFLYHHGFLPSVIDHKNRNTEDNKIENLRIASNSENAKNRKIASTNTSGVTGVYFNKQQDKWFAMIWVDKKRKFLGYFENINDAINARKNAEMQFYKEFSPCFNESQ